jgi:hypothetical protein
LALIKRLLEFLLTSSSPVAETWPSPITLARWRPQTPERVPEPEPESPLVLACLPRCRDGLGDVGGGILALEDRLSGNACRRRCFPKEAAFLQFPQNQSSAPIEFHGVSLCQTRLSVHRVRPRGDNDNRGLHRVLHEFVSVSAFLQLVDRSERDPGRSGKKIKMRPILSKVPSLSAFTGYSQKGESRPTP